jgi:predicted TPR repeat methyltransferase
MNRKERRAARRMTAPARPGALSGDRFGLAVEHFGAGRLAEAERACREVLALDPTHFDALTMLGLIAMRAGRHDIAADVLARAVALNDGSSDCHFNRGFALASLGRFDEAAHHLTRAIEINPAFAEAMIGLGNVRKQLGDLDAAAAQYRRALVLRPDPTAHYNLANVLLAQGRPEEAVASYRAALGNGPGSPELFNNLAQALAAQSKVADAMAAYRQALAFDPNNAEVLTNLGTLVWHQGDAEQAMALYQRALALRPDSLEARNNLATVLLKQERFTEARECLEKALAFKPDHPDTQVNLCSALYALSYKDFETAIGQARRLLATYDGPLLRRGLAGLVGEAADESRDRDYARAVFDRFANSFDSTLSSLGYLDMPRAIADALAIDTRTAAMDILDAGCGTGLCGPVFKPFARSLIGVDVSPRMLEKARERAIYDDLHAGDATDFMRTHTDTFDLIVSSDVLPYVGNLSPFLRAAHGSLHSGGQLATSAECLDGEADAQGYHLFASGRYKHSRNYLEEAFEMAGFKVAMMMEATMRREAGHNVAAWIVVGHKR